MKVLIFDRKIESLNFVSEQFQNAEYEVVIAENASKLLNYILNPEDSQFDALVLCRKELTHYGINEEYFLAKGISNFICSYLHCDDYHIKKLNISYSYANNEENLDIKYRLERTLKKCEKEEALNQNFISALPKKSAILLNQLLIKEKDGLSDDEIAKLFWGENYHLKMNCIYNHIYNLRKALKAQYKNLYIIHKEKNKYKLIKLKKEA